MSESADDWQVEEIRKGLAEADAGDFATEEEMARIIAKWARRNKGEQSNGFSDSNDD